MKALPHCPCGANASYPDCCGRFLDAGQFPATAEALMRSRYVAYVQRRADYLLRTWHSTTRPEVLDFSTDNGHWLGLKVIRAVAGRAEDEQKQPWNSSLAIRSAAKPIACTKSAGLCEKRAGGSMKKLLRHRKSGSEIRSLETGFVR